MQTRIVLALFAIGVLLLAEPALAYLDPASGSMLLQIVLGGIAGFFVLVRLYWHRLLKLFGVRADAAEDEAAAE